MIWPYNYAIPLTLVLFLNRGRSKNFPNKKAAVTKAPEITGGIYKYCATQAG